LGVTEIHDLVDLGSISNLVRAVAPEPIILVHRDSDNVRVPRGDRLRDRGRDPLAWRALISGGVEFHSIDINAFEANRAARAGREDLVPDHLKGGGSGLERMVLEKEDRQKKRVLRERRRNKAAPGLKLKTIGPKKYGTLKALSKNKGLATTFGSAFMNDRILS
jgi:hypothetical protein